VTGFVPYCGLAPVPGSLSWKLEPFLIGSLLALAAANLAYARLRAAATRDLAAGFVGWLLLSLAFVSPLCNLSVALFSARATQHADRRAADRTCVASGLLTGAMAGAEYLRMGECARLRGDLLALG